LHQSRITLISHMCLFPVVSSDCSWKPCAGSLKLCWFPAAVLTSQSPEIRVAVTLINCATAVNCYTKSQVLFYGKIGKWQLPEIRSNKGIYGHRKVWDGLPYIYTCPKDLPIARRSRKGSRAGRARAAQAARPAWWNLHRS